MPMPKEMGKHATEAQYNALGHNRLDPEDREMADGLLADTFRNFAELDEDDVEEILEQAKHLADQLADDMDTEGFDEAEVGAAANTIGRIKETEDDDEDDE